MWYEKSMSVPMWLTALVLLCAIRRGFGETVPWWKNAIYYRVLVDSFMDSDGDGLGDLKGKIFFENFL